MGLLWLLKVYANFMPVFSAAGRHCPIFSSVFMHIKLSRHDTASVSRNTHVFALILWPNFPPLASAELSKVKSFHWTFCGGWKLTSFVWCG